MAAQKPVFTVSELTQHLKGTLAKDNVLGGKLTVQGELSNVKPSSRGHLYFTLKDAGAGLSGVMWASTCQRLAFKPTEGMEVFATGQIDVYAPSGSYSLVVSKLEPVGMGALQLAFQQLKEKLDAEGLFDADRKRPLPAFPWKIGLVTAQTGAVLHDMMRVIRRKNPLLDVLLAPCKVQGAGAAEAIATQIERLQNSALGLDLILVARGGGSFEDLFCFSEERVVRAIVASRLPVVTGIGHEPDFSLADAAADASASTPTAAAELVTPDVHELQASLLGAAETMSERAQRSVLFSQQALDTQRQELQYLFKACGQSATARLENLQQALTQQMQQRFTLAESSLQKHCAELNAYSPLSTMARGYCVAQTTQGALLRSVKQVPLKESFLLRFADGEAVCKVVNPALP
jgi:exodeoxyribonuclease VII large subunit